jgi:hypothetical protein
VVVILIDGERWVEVDTLGDSGPGDSHFVVDRSGGSAQIRFGDGRQGRVPPAGPPSMSPPTREAQAQPEMCSSFPSSTAEPS